MIDATALDMPTLTARINELKQSIRVHKDVLTDLENELSRRVAPFAQNHYEAAGKDSGQVTFLHEGRQYKAEIRKTVTWDSGKLQAIAASMPWAAVERLFNIEFTIAESKFNAISDDDLLAKIVDARTTKLSDMKISVLD